MKSFQNPTLTFSCISPFQTLEAMKRRTWCLCWISLYLNRSWPCPLSIFHLVFIYFMKWMRNMKDVKLQDALHFFSVFISLVDFVEPTSKPKRFNQKSILRIHCRPGSQFWFFGEFLELLYKWVLPSAINQNWQEYDDTLINIVTDKLFFEVDLFWDLEIQLLQRWTLKRQPSDTQSEFHMNWNGWIHFAINKNYYTAVDHKTI